MSDEERIKRVEEAIVIMKNLILRYDERMDTFGERLVTFDEEMKKSREDFEFKMNAVVDAQIRNDEQIAKLNISTSNLEISTSKLEISTSKLEISSRQLEVASRSQLGRIETLEAA